MSDRFNKNNINRYRQPDVFRFAEYLKTYCQCQNVLELKKLFPYEAALGLCSQEGEALRKKINKTVIVGVNLIEYSNSIGKILAIVKKVAQNAPACILSTPARDLLEADNHSGQGAIQAPDANWNLEEFERLLVDSGLHVDHIGLTVSCSTCRHKDCIVAVVSDSSPVIGPDYNNFRVVALLAAYNEEDVIYHAVKKLIDGGIYVYVIDNWSTDKTPEILRRFKGSPFFLGVERFPPEGPEEYFNLRRLLRRKEELTGKIEAHWFINGDVDEVRDSPWPGVSLKQGIYIVDRQGYNAINHTELTFWPVDDLFTTGMDFLSYFNRCSFVYPHVTENFHVKAWKNTGRPVSFADTAGHEAAFEGRRTYPYKFLLRHYPIRNQKQGEKKVFHDRKPRYSPEEKNIGWHVHYNGYTPGCSFIRKPGELILFDESFYRQYLLERLTGEIMRL